MMDRADGCNWEAWEQLDLMRLNKIDVSAEERNYLRARNWHRTENGPNLPPSVAREGGQEYYQMFE